jgi:methanogenic corrinoid protein MtbC1
LAEPQNRFVNVTTQELAQEIVATLQALDNLTLVAIGEVMAKLEARRQIGGLAELLIELAARTDKADFAMNMNLLADKLAKLPIVASEEEEEDSEEEASPVMEQSEINRRLALNFPSHLNQSSQQKNLKQTSVRKVMVACLERSDETPFLVRQAVANFDKENWNVFDLGDNVPLMVLLSSALEKRPSVVVLVISNGSLLTEATSLVADLKRKLYGIKVVAVGPLLKAQTNVGLRLQADLYAPETGKAAELADHALSPLQQMGNPLKFETEQMIAIADNAPATVDDIPTSPGSPEKAEG